MKKIKLLLVALVLMSSTTIMAQNKIAYLNSEEILMAMPETDSAMKKLEAFGKELQETLESMQVEYNNKANDFVKKSTEWSQAMQQQKQKELQSLQENIRAYEEAANPEYQKKQQELMTPVIKKLQDAITAVGKDNGFTYIINAGALAYVDESTATNAAQLVKNKLGIKDKPAAK